MVDMFQDVILNSVFENCSPDGEVHIKKLNKISHDIKVLQSVLKKYAVPCTEFICDADNNMLIWDGTYIVLDADGLQKRLIECKANIRIKIADCLPKFLKACFENIMEGIDEPTEP